MTNSPDDKPEEKTLQEQHEDALYDLLSTGKTKIMLGDAEVTVSFND